MRRLALLLVLPALALSFAAPVQARDPQLMSRAQWNDIHEGEQKSAVNNDCGTGGCVGVKTDFYNTWNGNKYYAWEYATPVGNAFSMMRFNGTNWIVGFFKSWCPGNPVDQPTGDCVRVNFY